MGELTRSKKAVITVTQFSILLMQAYEQAYPGHVLNVNESDPLPNTIGVITSFFASDPSLPKCLKDDGSSELSPLGNTYTISPSDVQKDPREVALECMNALYSADFIAHWVVDMHVPESQVRGWLQGAGIPFYNLPHPV